MAEEVQGQAETQPALSVPESMNIHEAADHLSAVMERQEQSPRDDKGRFVAKQEATAEETKAEEEAPPAEEAVEEEAPAPRKLKLKYKGEDVEMDEPEVIRLAQMGHDYTQKSQALAKERDELPTKIKAEVDQRAKAYEQSLEVLKSAVEKMAGIDKVDLNKLALEDPTRAQQEFFKQLQFQQTLQNIVNEQQKLTRERQEELQATMRKQAHESVEKLEAKIPGWDNTLYGKVLKTAVKEYGFDSKEVNAISDYRAIEVLHDAMKYRELIAAKPKTVDKKVAAAPKVIKPGTADKPDQKAQKVDERRQALHKSGNRNDAVALVEEMLAQGKNL